MMAEGRADGRDKTGYVQTNKGINDFFANNSGLTIRLAHYFFCTFALCVYSDAGTHIIMCKNNECYTATYRRHSPPSRMPCDTCADSSP